MARSATSSPIAFPSEVARYLAVEDVDIERMTRVHKLPYIEVPKKTRNVKRIPLRDFHAWVVARAKNPAPHLASYETFLADFNKTARPDPL